MNALRLPRLLRAVCEVFGTHKDLLQGASELPAVVRPRHAAAYLMHRRLHMSQLAVERVLHKSSKFTYYACIRTERRLVEEPDFAEKIAQVRNRM